MLSLLKKYAQKWKSLPRTLVFHLKWRWLAKWVHLRSIPYHSHFNSYITAAFVNFLNQKYIFFELSHKNMFFLPHVCFPFPRACEFPRQIFGLRTCRKLFPVTRAHIKELRRVPADIKQRDLPTVLESLLVFQALKLITKSFRALFS